MNKKVRRALLIGAGLLFVVVTPMVVLYAIGYRFVLSNQQPQPVGVLFIDIAPRGGTVVINDNPVGNSPEVISGLPVGPVHVRVEKEGYTPWEKTLMIEATKATEVQTAKLFAPTVSLDTVAEQVVHFALSPNRRLLAAIDERNRLHILNTLGQPSRGAVTLPDSILDILWSPDSSNILIRTATGYHLVAVDSEFAPQLVPALLPLHEIAWDQRLPGRLLGLTVAQELVAYSTATGGVQTIARDVRLFAPTSRNIVTIVGANEVVWYSMQGTVERRQTILDSATISTIMATPAGAVAVSDAVGKVTIITREREELSLSVNGTIVGWSPDGSTLLVQLGSNELAAFNVDNERATYLPLQQLHSLVRLARPISHPQWFAGGTHVVFQVDDEITISEVDTRDRAIQFTVDSTNTGNAQTAVGEDGLVLLYLKSQGADTALVSRPLVTAEDQ